MSAELKELIKIVKSAGEKVLEVYQNQPRAFKKEDKSIVTEADLASEKVILSSLKKYNYGILSEETTDDLTRLNKEKTRILDPLDGTNDFLKKTGEFSIMLALVYKKAPILAVVYKPVGEKLYYAEKGKGAHLAQKNKLPKKLRVSDISNCSEARFLFSRHHLGDREKKFIGSTRLKQVDYVGSFGVKLGLIAEGVVDGHFNLSDKTSQWDICAPDLILREAGGEVTDMSGEKFIYNRREVKNLHGIVASNGLIHSEIIEGVGQLI